LFATSCLLTGVVIYQFNKYEDEERKVSSQIYFKKRTYISHPSLFYFVVSIKKCFSQTIFSKYVYYWILFINGTA